MSFAPIALRDVPHSGVILSSMISDDDTLGQFETAYQGLSCSIQRREFDWIFLFGDEGTIVAEAPWRIVQDGRIVHAMSDDGQKFGLAEAVDGEARANGLLEAKFVERIELDRMTADLRLHFSSQTRIDLFNASSGYEAWQATFRANGKSVLAVGVGGGGVTVFRS